MANDEKFQYTVAIFYLDILWWLSKICEITIFDDGRSNVEDKT